MDIFLTKFQMIECYNHVFSYNLLSDKKSYTSIYFLVEDWASFLSISLSV